MAFGPLSPCLYSYRFKCTIPCDGDKKQVSFSTMEQIEKQVVADPASILMEDRRSNFKRKKANQRGKNMNRGVNKRGMPTAVFTCTKT